MQYEQLAKDIIENVGGKENVKSVVHCVTRLRFKLKDEDKANTEVLESMDGVVSVMKSGGQYQVVIGNHVPDVYKAVQQVGGFESQEDADDDEGEQQGLFNKLIDIISGIFAPTLGVLAATGMIKGFNALFLSLGLYAESSGTYNILQAVGDSLFYFFPIFLGLTAMKKFNGNQFVGMAIGGALVYPAMSNLENGDPLYTLFSGTILESPVHITFLGIPVILMTYSSSVIPIILSTFVASKIEKWLTKIIPSVVKTFLVPFFTLLIIVPVAFIVIGPVATWLGLILGNASNWVFEISPVIAGLVLGGFWQVLVMFGLHWGFIPIGLNNLSVAGSDPILAYVSATSLATTGVVLGVMVKTKNQNTKTLSIPAAISSIFGVSEPAIYGITLPLKRPFILTLITSAVGGGIMGLMGTKVYMLGGLGIFGIPSKIGPNGLDMGFWGGIVAMVVNLILGFILAYFFGLKNETTDDSNTNNEQSHTGSKKDKQEVVSPLTGNTIALSEVKDAAFSSNALGKGTAINPTEGNLMAPIAGTVSAIFPTNHAVGITDDYGTEVLIHIGLDTVQLEGKFFEAYVAQGDKVEKGQTLIEFDIEQIQQAGFSTTTPIVITNLDSQSELIISETETVDQGDKLITIMNESHDHEESFATVTN
ncbi:PTS system beta-glucoside-specific transporter subunits IIABC [Gracilibacillus halophilus YIM-C55.5]|uniref:PTS system beta-glucoside-specific transporter subunits IIABC n=1 Tax=Gracilibacillus halophilus YIM-C55.5 TaxID=1308866 RepID=N4WCX9_9BACI|nr:beta-glucoside-specific PTS transporter subunit IIABC [Gracilibacillus halophilus]ENH98133.1 PTS system beta-glucoside-specific transporter subunits IIABC [Gracilibacillus halophilus YIM-C55.5]